MADFTDKLSILESYNSSEIETELENEGLDEVEIIEVANNNGIRLYEFDKDCDYADASVDEVIINEFFPDFVVKEDKGYLIRKGNKIYYY